MNTETGSRAGGSDFRDTDPADAPRPAGSRAARPRDAATLILLRRDAPRPRVLMGRRHGGHAFMPGKWVFPGGRVDRGDARAPAAIELRPEVRARLELRTPAASVRALGMAAIRETFEEAGLLLARPAEPRAAAGGWRAFLALGALPDLGALEFVARAVTPAYHPKRFDARFFTADAERLLSLDRREGTGELDEIAWFALEDARKLDLPAITRFVLAEVERRLDGPERPVPFVRTLRGARDLQHL